MRALLLLLITAALLATPALASHVPVGRCDSGAPYLGVVQLGDGTAERTFYVDDRNYAFGNGLWLYQESNGIFTPRVYDPGPPRVQYWWVWVGEVSPVVVGGPDHNLQRGGESVLNPVLPDELDSREICMDDPNIIPDTLLY